MGPVASVPPSGTYGAIPPPDTGRPAANRPLGTKELAIDTDRDGGTDAWVTVNEGQVTKLARDTDRDGKPDFTTTFSRGEGQPVAEERVKPDTGQVASRTEFERGVTSRKQADEDGDGKPDHWWYYLGGRLSKETRDTNGDGNVDETKEYRGEKLARIQRDEDRNGTFEKTDVFEAGRKVRTEVEDKEGPVSLVYDASGAQVIRRERDTNGDGRPDIVVALDPPTGTVLREDRDLNGDGRPDVSAYYENGKVVRREISGEYLRAQKSTTSPAAPGVNLEKRDYRNSPGT
jgi:hypothetical protein